MFSLQWNKQKNLRRALRALTTGPRKHKKNINRWQSENRRIGPTLEANVKYYPTLSTFPK